MPSLISGYEYDIFISYRHKDNKGDHWVTEFVNALKTELEATFKEDISIYFDESPHDGLHENHEVDDSLREKLRCLILIPIVSRTYCDPKAFAWEHEFIAFVKQAREDKFGLKTKLAGGNVASRVLPIKIHEIDASDKQLFETEVEGVMRSIDFIYKSTGVNRALTPSDNPEKNQNQTFYRDQINKVANAIKDVLDSLTTKEVSGDGIATDEAAVDKPLSAKPIKKKTRAVPTGSLLYKLKNGAQLSRKIWRMVPLVLFFFAVAFAAYWLGRENAPPPPDRALIAYDIPLTNSLERTWRRSLAISPDGKFLVYVMNKELNLKSLNSNAPSAPIPGTTGVSVRNPFFSPDGQWIGFENTSDDKIMKVQLQGGSPVSVCDLEGAGNGINWYENEIIFAVGGAIYRVPDSGGSPNLIYPLNKSENDPQIWNPQLLPDKSTLLFSQKDTVDGSWDIRTWKIGSDESPAVLIDRGRDGRFLNSGHIAYSMDHRLYVSQFDSKTNRIISEPQVITTTPVYEASGTGVSQFDFSENGILVYYERQALENNSNLVWIDRSGTKTPITSNPKNYISPTVSHDGQHIAVDNSTAENDQIEIINPTNGTSVVFVDRGYYPVWTADNSSIIYIAGESFNEIFEKPLDLSHEPNLLWKFDLEPGQHIEAGNMSSDGRYLFLSPNEDIGYYDVMNKTYEELDFINTPGWESFPAISPDGKWLAYMSDNTGIMQVYVAPFPGPGLPSKISLDVGSNPVWAPDMKAIYYVGGGYMWEVRVRTEPTFSAEKAEPLFQNNYTRFYSGTNEYGRFDIHPDGDRFLGVGDLGTGTEYAIKVISNWEQELKGK